MIAVKIFFRKQKCYLRVEIYKKLTLKEETLKSEVSIGEIVKLKNQKDRFSETPEQKEFIEYIENKQKIIDYNLFKKYFNFTSPVLIKQLYKIKNKKEYNELVNVIKSGLIDLKDEIKKNV